MSFEGDPKVIMTKDGADLVYKDGQPVMDAGFENQVLMQLFTDNSWVGNLLVNDAEKIGSDFEEKVKQAITVSSIAISENSAKQAIQNDAFGNIEVNIENPQSSRLDVFVEVAPHGQDTQSFFVTRNGINWINQTKNPANRQI